MPEPPARRTRRRTGAIRDGCRGRLDRDRPDDALPPTSILPIEAVVRGYLAGSGWKEYQATGDGLRDRAARGPARERPAARADLHAGDEGRGGRARREHRLRRRWSRSSASRAMAARVRDRSAHRAVPLRGRRRRAAAGILLADTKFEFGHRPGDRRAPPHRRGPDARFVALLGCRDVRAGPPAGELRQAVRARLARDPAVGQDRARSGPARTTSSTARAPATSRPSSGSPAPASSATCRRTSSPHDARFRFAVNVTPKPGILDPQGRAVEGSLGHLGIDGVSDVRVGRRVELTVDAADEAAARGRRRAAGVGAAVEPAHRGVRDRAARRDLVAVAAGQG